MFSAIKIAFTKAKLYIGAGILLATVVYVGYSQIRIANLKSENHILEVDNTTYKDTIADQQLTLEATTAALRQSMLEVARQANASAVADEVQQNNNNKITNLGGGRLSNAITHKPILTERILNDGIIELMREFEKATSR